MFQLKNGQLPRLLFFFFWGGGTDLELAKALSKQMCLINSYSLQQTKFLQVQQNLNERLDVEKFLLSFVKRKSSAVGSCLLSSLRGFIKTLTSSAVTRGRERLLNAESEKGGDGTMEEEKRILN